MIAKLVERVRSMRGAAANDLVSFERELGLALEDLGDSRSVPESTDVFVDIMREAAQGRVQVIRSPDTDTIVVISQKDLASLLPEPAETITLGEAMRNLPHRLSGPVPSVRGRPPARLHLGRRSSPISNPTNAAASQDDR